MLIGDEEEYTLLDEMVMAHWAMIVMSLSLKHETALTAMQTQPNPKLRNV